MTHPFRFGKVGRFHKAEGNTIFGWAFVSTIKGEPYFDLGDGVHSDHIPVDSILPVSKAFMRDSAKGLHQHSGDAVAEVLYAYPMLDDIMSGNGIASEKQGLIIGWDTDDPELAKRAIEGDDTGFSIGGYVDAWDIVDGDGNVIESVSLTKASRFGASLTSFGKLAGNVTKDQLRRVFRSWGLDEISLVDFPMQEPALVGVVKGRYGAKPTQAPRILKTRRVVSKSAALTSIESGHQHTCDPQSCDASGIGRTSWDKSDGDEYGHDHAFVRNADGTITIAVTDGHSHTVDMSAHSSSGTGARVVQMHARAENLQRKSGGHSVGATEELITMNGQQQPNGNEIESLKAANKSLTEQLAKAQRFGLLTDAQKAYLKSLPESDHDGFLAKSNVDREREIKAAVDADPIRYTAKSGKVYRESQAELADMAKKLDESETEKAAATEKAADAGFAKTASEKMARFGKTAALHAKMLKAMSKGMTAEEFAEAVEMLDGVNTALEGNFEETGADNGGSVDVADGGSGADPADAQPKIGKGGTLAQARAKLDKMAADYAAANKVRPEIAKARLLKNDKTAKGLYETIRTLQKQAQRAN